MALTRRLLEGMGIEDKQIETIIEAHSETVNGLKADRDKYKEQAQAVPDLQRQLEDAKAAAADPHEWERKYNEAQKALDDFKAQVSAEKAEAEKATAYRKMLADAGIDGHRIDTIMRVTDLSGVEMEDGALKDVDRLTEQAKAEWADFIVKTRTEGERPQTPPKTIHGVAGADPEVSRMMQERHERLYGKAREGE